MAIKTHAAFLEQALALKTLSNDLMKLRSRWDEIIDQHNARGFSDASPTPAYIQEDVDGNINGTNYATADYINGITMLLQLNNFFDNAAVAQGDYNTTLHNLVDI